MFHINYYEDINGNVPIREFIEGLNLKLKVKVFGCIELLEQYGNQLGMPFSRYLRDEIFELRILQGNNSVRLLYFYYESGIIILTHGFIKKTQKTPKREIEKAKTMRKDWLKRHERL